MSFEKQAYEIEDLWEPHWFGPEEQEKVDVLARSLPADARSLVDVGCGNGLFLRRLARPGDREWTRLCGVDRSLAALKHVECEKYVASADALPFEDREFDVVTSFDVIEHLPVDVYARALRELTRVAGRYILINVPFKEDLRSSLLECPSCFCRFNVNYHLRSFEAAQLEKLFGEPFVCRKVFHIRDVSTYPQPLVASVAKVKSLFANGSGKLPSYAVCPACGTRGEQQSAPEADAGVKPSRVKAALKKLVPMRKSYRWIAGLYERSES